MDFLHTLDRIGGLVMNEHLVLKSGKHASGYVNVDPMFPDVQLTARVCRNLGDPYIREGIEVVASPATGGVALATLTALALCDDGRKVKAVWADKDGEGFRFEREGFVDAIHGRKVLVVDDVMSNANARGSVYKVCRLVESHGGILVGVSIICNRCGGTAEDLGVPRLKALESVTFEAFEAESCPLCVEYQPIIVNIGHGEAYQQAHPDYPGGFKSYRSSSS